MLPQLEVAMLLEHVRIQLRGPPHDGDGEAFHGRQVLRLHYQGGKDGAAVDHHGAAAREPPDHRDAALLHQRTIK